MKKALLTIALLAVTATKAHAARCIYIPSGWVQIDHDSNWAKGRNYNASLACSRGAPDSLYLWGGLLCQNRYIFGRTSWNRPYSCRINAVWG